MGKWLAEQIRLPAQQMPSNTVGANAGQYAGVRLPRRRSLNLAKDRPEFNFYAARAGKPISRGPARTALSMRRNCAGFTLVEMTFVLVILGIVSVFGGRFIFTTLEIYQHTQQRTMLALHAATVIEQLTRELRAAAPASVKVTDSGQCVEFLPALTAVYALGQAPKVEVQGDGRLVIASDAFTLSEPGRHLVLEPLRSNTHEEFATRPAMTYVADLQPGTHQLINIESGGATPPELSGRRLYITAAGVRYCLEDGQLFRIGENSLQVDGQRDYPSEFRQLVARDLVPGEPAFSLPDTTEVGPRSLQVDVTFVRRSLRFPLRHTVSLFNGP